MPSGMIYSSSNSASVMDEFGQPYEEWFITDYECPIYGVQKMLGEYESLDKLNYLAALIDELG